MPSAAPDDTSRIRPYPSRDHVLLCCPRSVEGAREMSVDDREPILVARTFEDDHSAAHEHMQPAMIKHRAFHERLDRLSIGDIAMGRARFTAVGFDGCRDRLSRLRVHI